CYRFGFRRSYFNHFIKENIILIKINTNCNAETIEAVCSALSPPDQSKTAAAPAWIRPHANLIFIGGFNIPFVVCIPITNVAESADVMKNVLIKTIASTVEIVPHGNSFNVEKSAISV